VILSFRKFVSAYLHEGHISAQSVVTSAEVPQEILSIDQVQTAQKYEERQALCTCGAKRFSSVVLLGKPTRTIRSKRHGTRCFKKRFTTLKAYINLLEEIYSVFNCHNAAKDTKFYLR
jgi:hypothetical protein